MVGSTVEENDTERQNEEKLMTSRTSTPIRAGRSSRPSRRWAAPRAALRGVMVREIVNYSSFWRSSTFSSTVDPTIYLLAFGFGFGSLVSMVAGSAAWNAPPFRA